MSSLARDVFSPVQWWEKGENGRLESAGNCSWGAGAEEQGGATAPFTLPWTSEWKATTSSHGNPRVSLFYFWGAGFVFNHKSYACEVTFPAKVTGKGNSAPVLIDFFSHIVDCAYTSPISYWAFSVCPNKLVLLIRSWHLRSRKRIFVFRLRFVCFSISELLMESKK